MSTLQWSNGKCTTERFFHDDQRAKMCAMWRDHRQANFRESSIIEKSSTRRVALTKRSTSQIGDDMIKLIFVVVVAYCFIVLTVEVIIPRATGRQVFPSWRLRKLRKRLEKANSELEEAGIKRDIEKLEAQVKASKEGNVTCAHREEEEMK